MFLSIAEACLELPLLTVTNPVDDDIVTYSSMPQKACLETLSESSSLCTGFVRSFAHANSPPWPQMYSRELLLTIRVHCVTKYLEPIFVGTPICKCKKMAARNVQQNYQYHNYHFDQDEPPLEYQFNDGSRH